MDFSWIRLKQLGKGSFGSVFLAESSDGYLLAVKSSLIEKSLPLQFERCILKFFHGCPEIIQCYGECSTNERGLRLYNLALEYASGGSLLDLMKKYGGRVPERHVACYTRMILKGLSSIHKKGFVHCDLKPGNILVFPPKNCGLCQLKIADFGQTKFPGEKQRNWRFRFRGTPIYMSPESVADGKIEAALDVWSLGCVVLEMLTGERPWKLNKHQLLFNFVTLAEPPTIPNYISENGKDFLRKCFEMNPERRWTVYMLLQHPFVVEEYKRECLYQIQSQLLEINRMCEDFKKDINHMLNGLKSNVRAAYVANE